MSPGHPRAEMLLRVPGLSSLRSSSTARGSIPQLPPPNPRVSPVPTGSTEEFWPWVGGLPTVVSGTHVLCPERVTGGPRGRRQQEWSQH